MNIEQITKEPAVSESARSTETISLENFAPVGTFAGSKDTVLRIRNGQSVAADTGDQGGGQN